MAKNAAKNPADFSGVQTVDKVSHFNVGLFLLQ